MKRENKIVEKKIIFNTPNKKMRSLESNLAY